MAANCVCSVNITKEGKEALLRLSNGDMRRALNILQACHAAYDRIDDTAIYTCTGHPHPKDIQRIVDTMMNDDFTTAYSSKLQFMDVFKAFRCKCD